MMKASTVSLLFMRLSTKALFRVFKINVSRDQSLIGLILLARTQKNLTHAGWSRYKGNGSNDMSLQHKFLFTILLDYDVVMSLENLPVVILCGGKGMRLREMTEYVPKALVPVGNMPIVLHVMKIYAHYGFTKFILCLGYKGDLIKQYFMNFDLMTSDFSMTFGQKPVVVSQPSGLSGWEITFADTGLDTQTGTRIKRIENYLETDNFFATYCDGLANVDLFRLLKHHLEKNKIGTLTAVHTMSPFGIVEERDGIAISFKEKLKLPGLVNGGFFVFKRQFLEYLDDQSVLEEEPLRALTEKGELAVYCHEGFWACMDTFKDFERLNSLWNQGRMLHTGLRGPPPWKVWE